MIDGIQSGGSAMRGRNQDRERLHLLKRRQAKRRDIEDADAFVKVMMGILPEYYNTKA